MTYSFEVFLELITLPVSLSRITTYTESWCIKYGGGKKILKISRISVMTQKATSLLSSADNRKTRVPLLTTLRSQGRLVFSRMLYFLVT
jgi:hypothetical protein